MSDSSEISDLLIIANICECEGEGNGDTIKCSVCERLYHQACLKYSLVDIAERIKTFVCNSCESTTPFITEWRVNRPTRAQKLDKQRNYFEVEKILAHRVHFRRGARRRVFQIKWKGYSPAENSWLPESFLDGCLDTLQKYLKDKGLPASTIVGLLGAPTHKQTINERNWVSMKAIIEVFNYFKLYYFPKVNIFVGEWKKFTQNDGLYFLSFERHCFVILYYHQDRHGYIADGGNLFREEIDTASDIRSLLKINLTSCSYTQQTKVDHCGSSGVLIALEMIRAYQLGSKPGTLASPLGWKERITHKMHRFESAPLELPPLHMRRHRLACPTCGRGFKFGDRRGFYQHTKRCMAKSSSSHVETTSSNEQ